MNRGVLVAVFGSVVLFAFSCGVERPATSGVPSGNSPIGARAPKSGSADGAERVSAEISCPELEAMAAEQSKELSRNQILYLCERHRAEIELQCPSAYAMYCLTKTSEEVRRARVAEALDAKLSKMSADDRSEYCDRFGHRLKLAFPELFHRHC